MGAALLTSILLALSLTGGSLREVEQANAGCEKQARLRRVTTCLVMVLLAFAVWGTTGPATSGSQSPPKRWPVFARFHCFRCKKAPRCFLPRREACWATEHAVPEWIMARLPTRPQHHRTPEIQENTGTARLSTIKSKRDHHSKLRHTHACGIKGSSCK